MTSSWCILLTQHGSSSSLLAVSLAELLLASDSSSASSPVSCEAPLGEDVYHVWQKGRKELNEPCDLFLEQNLTCGLKSSSFLSNVQTRHQQRDVSISSTNLRFRFSKCVLVSLYNCVLLSFCSCFLLSLCPRVLVRRHQSTVPILKLAVLPRTVKIPECDWPHQFYPECIGADLSVFVRSKYPRMHFTSRTGYNGRETAQLSF